ncbi:hypothetical protein BHE74_00029344 [Ensete ventricosum]|nr:hypothetical protein BHE74_00029344 [Ensete ventricosum]RZR76736.1 hypothetical protein BHM03_00001616 [Ensete ventricosum]
MRNRARARNFPAPGRRRPPRSAPFRPSESPTPVATKRRRVNPASESRQRNDKLPWAPAFVAAKKVGDQCGLTREWFDWSTKRRESGGRKILDLKRKLARFVLIGCHLSTRGK